MIATSAGCGAGEEQADGRLQAIAGSYPLAFAAEEIGGDAVEVENLTPPGVEPHDLELSARDVERIQSADLVLYLGRASSRPSRTPLSVRIRPSISWTRSSSRTAAILTSGSTRSATRRSASGSGHLLDAEDAAARFGERLMELDGEFRPASPTASGG